MGNRLCCLRGSPPHQEVPGPLMLGIPTASLHECPGSVITVELKTHEVYRGYLDDVEDNWNMHVTNITRTERDGRVTHLEHAYIRGSQIRFLIMPDMLKHAPLFKPRNPNAGVAAKEYSGRR